MPLLHTDAMDSSPTTSSLMMPAPTHAMSKSQDVLDTNMLLFDRILSPNFWDNILMSGGCIVRYRTQLLLYGFLSSRLSSGIVYGASGVGLITPRANSPGPFQ
jgi:hypothetical protein